MNILFPEVNAQALKPDSLKPDYRNHINIPTYNKSLMPLNKVTAGTGTWTELNPKVPRVDYIGVHFVNKDTGWACGDLGALIKTIDGGKSWRTIQTNTTLPILKVRSYNGLIVIASGYDGLILRSTDGGETFTQVTSGLGSGFDLWGLEIVNETLGWSCGATALLKTIDAGETWQIVNTPGYTGNLWWIEFMNESYGFIAADGKVLKTTDGGGNWDIIQAGDNAPLYSIDVIDSLHIAAAGYGGTSYRGKNMYSSDGGYTWINGGPLTFEPVNDIKYVNRDTGYVVMNNIIGWKTTNRGAEWTPALTGGEWELQFFEQDNVGYSVGTGLRIYKTENSFENWQRLIINDNFSDVFFINEEVGFVISPNYEYGQLYRTTDSGLSWKVVSGAPSGNDLHFLDNLTGFIAGDKIYKTTNGGNSWYQTNSLALGAGKIFFINETTGWATSGRNILKTTDGGENWFIQITLPSDSYTSIFLIDSLYGWATSRYIWQTINGGTNWIQRTDVPIYFCDDVFFIDSLRGWIISENKLYLTNNGGISWALDPQVYTYSRNFETISNTHFIITGTNIYESKDTGNVWQNITSTVGSYFISLHSPKEYLAFGVGRSGFIVKYFDSSIVPVELSQFSAELNENTNVRLQWTTESEKNNLGFEVMRSNDLIKWQKIGFVVGKGTSTFKSIYTFFDNNFSGSKVYYRLKQIDYNGHYLLSEIVTIEILVTDFFLSQNYPNPANPNTCLSFTLPQNARIKIELYAITGEKVKEILDDEKEKGIYKININLNDFSSGVYFYTMRTNSGYSATKKLILIK